MTSDSVFNVAAGLSRVTPRGLIIHTPLREIWKCLVHENIGDGRTEAAQLWHHKSSGGFSSSSADPFLIFSNKTIPNELSESVVWGWWGEGEAISSPV